MDIHIIDDDHNLRSLLTRIVQRLNYRAIAFSGPDVYLEYMGCAEYSVPTLTIISDLEMPGMSGFELMNVVRQANPDQRFIILTGGSTRSGPNDEFACFYFTKPVSMDKLDRALKAQAMCIESGPSPKKFGCASINDRCSFGVKEWHCPLREITRNYFTRV